MPPSRVERAPEGAKKSGSEGPLVGARVRVQCSDGVFYDGGVTAWDAASAEYKIVLDDGNPEEAHARPDARMRPSPCRRCVCPGRRSRHPSTGPPRPIP